MHFGRCTTVPGIVPKTKSLNDIKRGVYAVSTRKDMAKMMKAAYLAACYLVVAVLGASVCVSGYFGECMP